MGCDRIQRSSGKITEFRMYILTKNIYIWYNINIIQSELYPFQDVKEYEDKLMRFILDILYNK